MSFIAVYITHGTENAAQKITDYLLQKKLIACANIFPINSMYWWQEKIAQDKEWVSIVKTIPENWDLLQREVEAIHPYSVPCIMKIEVSANTAYEAWIRQEVQTS
ncbi:MAG: divalent-cation tolerance protein CutA [Bacteroidota bacterium]